ncbi:MAG: hypothetical protein PHR15_09170 [Atopobiaceae bacterium]|jgi:hypothetical protein|nr:hypothetical protein [Atopobiaceae bacterium]MCH4181323.1 hypothetical protein [Atopobiaceae bacterium]MCH4215062.1 hypothetical protein [Atopobiaceae bacterium]MCH4230614.1 hypothetical protein [Atopobiaceae bacterium]MCH4276787.1 hypothetical protein [Atopobiaceae bacterium]
MKFEKRSIASMPKCYAIAMFDGTDAKSFLIGVEKEGPTRRFALDGTPLETVTAGPGGVMTMVQVPGRADQFLSTTEFFSPNCGGDDAHISTYTKADDGAWSSATLCDLPYVHRFGILKGEDKTLWLLACTIKSACAYKEDWRFPGKVFAAPLTGDLERYGKQSQLALTTLRETQLKNHGFYTAPDRTFALVSTDDGVFRYTPPMTPDGEWQIDHITTEPTSDITLVDLDGDGKDELLCLSPFHGDTISVWHLDDAGTYRCVWTDPEKRPFMHAIWGGSLNGNPCAIVGHRKGDRDLLRIWLEQGTYHVEVIDHDFGPTNVWVYGNGDHDTIVAANRETDEVALYEAVQD